MERIKNFQSQENSFDYFGINNNEIIITSL
jgi:hypothetical protein